MKTAGGRLLVVPACGWKYNSKNKKGYNVEGVKKKEVSVTEAEKKQGRRENVHLINWSFSL